MSITCRAKKTYSNGRVKRGKPPLTHSPLKKTTYRKCLPELKRDFKKRCAYCMRSLARSADREMQVDHFNPRKKNKKIQAYSNLFLSDAHCNGTKSDIWPSKEQQAKGLHLLNCCEEYDYGNVIFEDSETHELVGTTPAAIYHIEVIDLNAQHLVDERRKRSELRSLLTRPAYLDIKNKPEVYEISKALQKISKEDFIPYIPPPPSE